MSFIKTLATLAAGIAAAKGYDKFRKMGGIAGLEETLRNSGKSGGMSEQLGDMADRIGLPGGKAAVQDMFAKFGPKAADATDAASAGIGGLVASMQGAYTAGARQMGEMISAITGATPAGPIVEENARMMIRAMIQAAKCDGEIDPEERARIMAHLTEATPEEKAFVEAELAAPLDLTRLVADTGAAMKAQVYATSVMAIRADNPAEQAYLKQLGDMLGLDQKTRDGIHAGMGIGA